jgi:hypothetical protein
LCADNELLDLYIWNLGAYCQHTRTPLFNNERADYTSKSYKYLHIFTNIAIVALQMLKHACPQVKDVNILERRQGI